MWKSNNISLRNVCLSDLQLLLDWENNPENWAVSETTQPYTEEEMIDFIVEQSAMQQPEQLRLMICINSNNEPIGAIDLFNINSEKKTASVGILINEIKHRNQGYATEALQLMKKNAKKQLKLSTLYCTIHSDNTSSIKLFSKCSFEKLSVKNGVETYFCSLH